MIDVVFPTAVHNRFSHCLGAAYVAYNMSEKLKLDEQEEKYALVGALLHDIGHGPFSHAFEQLLKTDNSKKIKHENWTGFFLKEFEKQLEEHNIDYKILSDIIQHKYNMSGEYNIVADIVSSQLDADRLDYLLRDAHFCGVPYGNPDITWICNHLTKIQETGNPPRLGFLIKGWRAIEHFLFCRRIMTQNVYHHHTKEVCEKLLVNFLIEISQETTLLDKITNINLRKFLKNANIYRQGKITEDDFIQENFNYYKTLTDYDIWMLVRDFAIDSEKNANANKIAQRIYQRKFHYSFRFEATCLGTVSSVVKNIKKELNILSDWQIFIIDQNVISYEPQEDPILIVDENNEVHRIQKYSYLLNIIGDKEEKDNYLAIDIDLFCKHKKYLKDKLKNYISWGRKGI